MAALAEELLADITRERSTEKTAVVRSDSKKRTRARHDWLERIVSRWEAASGITIPTERLVQLARELDERKYPESIARLAEEWILRGDSVKYGRLTIAHFYPTEEQLASLDLHIDRVLARERAEGYGYGFSAGKNVAQAEIIEELRYIELMARTKRIRHYARRMAAVRRRELEIEHATRNLRENQTALRRQRLHLEGKLERLVNYCCETDRIQIQQLLEGLG